MGTVIFAEKYSVAGDICNALSDNGKIKTTMSKTIFDKKTGKPMPSYKEITYNGKQVIVCWGHGHLCGLKQAQDYNPDYKQWMNMPMPFIPETYEIKPIKEELARIKELSELFKNATLIINATDFDREGDVIFYYLYTCLKCKTPFKRVHFSSMEAAHLKKAFSNLLTSDETRCITEAGRARGIADWLIGGNITALTTLKFAPPKTMLSVGRVQTPTLKIVVDREKQLRGFSANEYYVLTGEFTTENGVKYKGECKTRYDKKEDIGTKLPSTGTISEVEKTIAERGCPQLFTQATLAMAANDKYGLTLKETLDASQLLYEAHLTTYPRTDSPYLTEDMYDEVNDTLRKLSAIPLYDAMIQGRKIPHTDYFFNDAEVEGHSAIIPTGVLPDKAAKPIGKREKQVYDLICRRTIATVMGKAKIEKTVIKTVADNFEFVTYGSVVTQKGCLEALGLPTDIIPPDVSKGEKVTCIPEIVARKTKAPPAYTDKTLAKAMIAAGQELDDEAFRNILKGEGEKGGIGRPSTRAAIVERLVSTGYLERKGKSIRATDQGIALIDTIPIEEIKSPILTAQWELRLDKIAKGEESFEVFVKDIEALTREWCDRIKSMEGKKIASASDTNEVLGTCPKCGGSIRRTKFGYGCSNWKPEDGGCKYSLPAKLCSKTITPSIVKKLLKTGTTGELKGFKSKGGKSFSAKLKLDNDDKLTFEF
ncbi:MAG: DNA topoisomerase [Acutalibacteraceae bacterium]|nr:DNA topoisomerase [Acutalibacteraceae bacterium]